MTNTRHAKNAPRLDFAVTPEQISEAIQRDSGHCMIADALSAAIPDAKYVSVDLATIRFTDLDAGWRYIYLTPRRAQEALLAFDQGDPVEPFQVKSLRAAQMIPTGTGRKARRNPVAPDDGEGAENAAPRTRAKLVKGGEGNTVPTKIGGIAPPIGSNAAGAIGRQPRNAARGKRREYGLRSYIR